MSASHHGNEPGPPQTPGPEKAARIAALHQRFLDQVNGVAKREFSAGRMGAEDDGVLTYAMATDTRHSTIIMRFGKPVEWIGLGITEAEQLRDELTERLMELRGVAT